MSNSDHVDNTRNYSSVPWYSAEEWKYVFQLIYGPKSNEKCKKEALQILLVWKSRCSKLPSGIESTLGLLEVDLQVPVVESDSHIPDRLLRLMYSSVIMRFINHTLDDVTKAKGLTLLQAGPVVNIPQWIVNLRHETAHAHELPSLSLLKKAANFAMNWLFTSYWTPQNDLISNYVIGNHIQSDDFDYNLSQLIYNHNLMAIFSYPRFRIRKLSDIPDEDIKMDVFNFINEQTTKRKHKIDMSIEIKEALSILIKMIDKFLLKSKKINKDVRFAKLMLDSESLFMTTDIEFSNKNNKDEEKLPDVCVAVWKPILTYLHTRDMLAALVKNLLSLVELETESPERRMRAAQWIREIAVGLFKSALFANIPFEFNREQKDVTRESFLHLVHHHPNQKKGLTLNLLHPVPEELSSKDFLYKVLENTNPYLKIYLKEILALLDTKLSQMATQNLIDLVDIVCGKKSGDSINDNIYTVSDITMEITNNKHHEVPSLIEDVHGPSNISIDMELGKWERASTDFDWGKYPIGVLPWQTQNVINPTLVFNTLH